MRLSDKRVERAVRAYADAKYDGDWWRVTVAELRGIVAVLEGGWARRVP